mmetsp:Transcript_25712/g.73970  ORF Transcript_25712/g.73970 Transcript_25712/m.73970 type:complete len:232 (+) Transcript_25712:597-1292(+)
MRPVLVVHAFMPGGPRAAGSARIAASAMRRSTRRRPGGGRARASETGSRRPWRPSRQSSQRTPMPSQAAASHFQSLWRRTTRCVRRQWRACRRSRRPHTPRRHVEAAPARSKEASAAAHEASAADSYYPRQQGMEGNGDTAESLVDEGLRSAESQGSFRAKRLSTSFTSPVSEFIGGESRDVVANDGMATQPWPSHNTRAMPAKLRANAHGSRTPSPYRLPLSRAALLPIA